MLGRFVGRGPRASRSSPVPHPPTPARTAPAPAAFLLLGDYPNSGMLDSGITSPTWNSYCVSDNIYADVDGDDLPDMAHARITARDAGELDPAAYDEAVIRLSLERPGATLEEDD